MRYPAAQPHDQEGQQMMETKHKTTMDGKLVDNAHLFASIGQIIEAAEKNPDELDTLSLALARLQARVQAARIRRGHFY